MNDVPFNCITLQFNGVYIEMMDDNDTHSSISTPSLDDNIQLDTTSSSTTYINPLNDLYSILVNNGEIESNAHQDLSTCSDFLETNFNFDEIDNFHHINTEKSRMNLLRIKSDIELKLVLREMSPEMVNAILLQIDSLIYTFKKLRQE